MRGSSSGNPALLLCKCSSTKKTVKCSVDCPQSVLLDPFIFLSLHLKPVLFSQLSPENRRHTGVEKGPGGDEPVQRQVGGCLKQHKVVVTNGDGHDESKVKGGQKLALSSTGVDSHDVHENGKQGRVENGSKNERL